jgi:hypothetical protein
MEAYELEFGTLSRSPTDPTRSVVTVTAYLPASGRQIAKLAWNSIRDGGCEQLTATIARPFDGPIMLSGTIGTGVSSGEVGPSDRTSTARARDECTQR